MSEQQKIQHRGLHAKRLEPSANNPREVAFANVWAKENDPERSCGPLLQALMVERSNQPGDGFERGLDIGSGEWTYFRTTRINQYEATIVATVVQWLGSNIGMCFLEESLKQCGYEFRKVGAR